MRRLARVYAVMSPQDNIETLEKPLPKAPSSRGKALSLHQQQFPTSIRTVPMPHHQRHLLWELNYPDSTLSTYTLSHGTRLYVPSW